MIKYLLYLSFIWIFLLGCKSKTKPLKVHSLPVIESKAENFDEIQKNRFLSSLDSTEFQFQTFSAKGSVNFNHNGDTHSADISIRLKKDEIIWFYINLSIIPVAQGYITPTEIKFKNLLNGEYTHKDFSYLQEMAGIPIRFQDLQALIIGNKLKSFLTDSTRLRVSTQGEYFLEGKNRSLQNRFSYNSHFRPLIIDLQDSINKRKVNLKYGNFLAQNGTFIPQSIFIQAQAPENNLEIQMDYRKIQINPEQDYPFHSPDGSN